MNVQEEGLKRTVGLWGLSANIVNIIVGAGIFALPALVAQKMGSTSLIAYLICGLLIILIMLCFAEAGSRVTNSGGSYTYVETAFGKYPGFLVAIFFIMGGVLADAAVSNALVDIIGTAFPIFTETWMRVLFFFVVFGGLACINIIGVNQGIGLVKINTIAKLIPLFLLIVVGWKNVSITNLYWESTPTVAQIGQTALLLFFAFQGGEVGLSVGGEIINPKKTIPKAIFISILGVLIFYILIQTVSQGVLGDQLAQFEKAPLAETAKVIFGPIGFTLLFIGAAISMFGNLSGEVLNNPRVLFALARDRVLPIKKLADIHKKYATPYVAILVYASTSFLIATFGGFEQLVNIASAAILVTYLGVALAVLKLRRMQPPAPNEFKIPGGWIVPIASALIILYFLSNLETNELIGSIVFTAILTIIYAIIAYLKKRHKAEINS